VISSILDHRLGDLLDPCLSDFPASDPGAEIYYGDIFNDNERESTDSIMIDLVLPFDDAYVVEVWSSPDAALGMATGSYELYITRFRARTIPEPNTALVCGVMKIFLSRRRSRSRRVFEARHGQKIGLLGSKPGLLAKKQGAILLEACGYIRLRLSSSKPESACEALASPQPQSLALNPRFCLNCARSSVNAGSPESIAASDLAVLAVILYFPSNPGVAADGRPDAASQSAPGERHVARPLLLVDGWNR